MAKNTMLESESLSKRPIEVKRDGIFACTIFKVRPLVVDRSSRFFHKREYHPQMF